MDVATLLEPASIRCKAQANGKKHALDLLSQMLAQAADGATAGEIMDALADRERLGSTGLGAAVAMPHARLAAIEHPVGAFLRLRRPVEFDSVDGKPVDLLFGLLVPEDSSAAELDDIRELAARLREPQLQLELRASVDPDELYQVLTDNLSIIET